MEDSYIENSVKTRLILAGIKEIEDHGIKDFSLRRVALTAQVSCAAPYRHFRDKDEMISEIIKYVASKWQLFSKEIENALSNDKRRLVIEMAVANLRFWIANQNYRSVLITASAISADALVEFEAPMLSAVDAYLESIGKSELSEKKKYALRALVYGSLILSSDAINRDAIVFSFREKLAQEFDVV